MSANKKTARLEDTGERISILWIVVVLNIAFADIVGFLNPGALADIMAGSVGFTVTQELVLAFSILLEIPIAMIFLSRVLGDRANRWANTIAGVITALFVIGGGSATLSYIFFATVEIAAISLIGWYAWRRPAQAARAYAIDDAADGRALG